MKIMRYIPQILATFIFLSFTTTALFAHSTEGQITTNQTDSLTQKNTVCYEVFGMDCPGCQSALEKQIKKIDGVAEAKASYKNKEVVITFEPDATVKEEEIHNRIKKANFTPGKKIEMKEDE
jgi:copper chaperone CopZ